MIDWTSWLAESPLPLSSDSVFWGAQYWDTGWFKIFVTALLVGFILFNISRASGKPLFIRRIPGLNAIEEAVGRATEMGKPVLMVPGLSDPVNAVAAQALAICAHVTKIAAKFSNPILVCAYSPSLYTLAQEVIRDVYQTEGIPDQFDPDSVRFISDRQFAFAAGVSGIIHREQTAATFFLGEFYAESLIFAETANSIGAIQVASSTETTQTPFFIAACDYVLIGDEFYAASAYLTREPVLVGSLVGLDWAKLFLFSSIVVGVVTATGSNLQKAAITGPLMRAVMEQKGSKDDFAAAKASVFEQLRLADTWAFSRFFDGDSPPADLKVERELEPTPATTQEGGK